MLLLPALIIAHIFSASFSISCSSLSASSYEHLLCCNLCLPLLHIDILLTSNAECVAGVDGGCSSSSVSLNGYAQIPTQVSGSNLLCVPFITGNHWSALFADTHTYIQANIDLYGRIHRGCMCGLSWCARILYFPRLKYSVVYCVERTNCPSVLHSKLLFGLLKSFIVYSLFEWKQNYETNNSYVMLSSMIMLLLLLLLLLLSDVLVIVVALSLLLLLLSFVWVRRWNVALQELRVAHYSILMLTHKSKHLHTQTNRYIYIYIFISWMAANDHFVNRIFLNLTLAKAQTIQQHILQSPTHTHLYMYACMCVRSLHVAHVLLLLYKANRVRLSNNWPYELQSCF